MVTDEKGQRCAQMGFGKGIRDQLNWVGNVEGRVESFENKSLKAGFGKADGRFEGGQVGKSKTKI